MVEQMNNALSNLLNDIQLPYFYEKELAGIDFNREIVEPGVLEKFPDGALGIRVDQDFWIAAVLPLKYKEFALKDIVAILWPEYVEDATFCPDSGTIEQKIFFTNQFAEHLKEENDRLNKVILDQNIELNRLRNNRFDLHERLSTQRKARDTYFIRQYTHLLTAMAHKPEPMNDRPGVCKVCGLFSFDRVHSKKYIDLQAQGYEPRLKIINEFEQPD
jgi:hypothetical protein